MLLSLQVLLNVRWILVDIFWRLIFKLVLHHLDAKPIQWSLFFLYDGALRNVLLLTDSG